jgi:hypothetical protein
MTRATEFSERSRTLKVWEGSVTCCKRFSHSAYTALALQMQGDLAQNSTQVRSVMGIGLFHPVGMSLLCVL